MINTKNTASLDDIIGRVSLVAVISLVTTLNKVGNEHKGLCPFHNEKTQSFTVYNNNGHERYKCFGCEARGDLLDWLEIHEGLSKADALKRAKELANFTPSNIAEKTLQNTNPGKTSAGAKQFSPIPVDAPAFDGTVYFPKHNRTSKLDPSMIFEYRDKDELLLGYVARIDRLDGSKWTPTITYHDDGQYHVRAFAMPRPLYGLDSLAAKPEAVVLIVEGEKAADAARNLLPDHTVVTWPGGSNAVGKVNWSLLSGRQIVIWPDADEPGAKAAASIAQRLTSIADKVVVIDPPNNVANGWDAADAELEGWTPDQAAAFIKTAVDLARANSPDDDDGTIKFPDPPEDASEALLAEAFSKNHAKPAGMFFNYSDRHWYCWEEQAGRLVKDERGEASSRAQSFLVGLTPATDNKRLRKLRTITNVEQLARLHRAVLDVDFADDDYLLPTRNGYVDLRIDSEGLFVISDPKPKRMVNQTIGTSLPDRSDGMVDHYDDRCPNFDKFMSDLTSGNLEYEGFIYRMAGYCLTGDISEQVLFYLEGPGGTGKSTFLWVLEQVLGELASTATMDVFADSKYAQHSTDLAMLKDARLVIATETNAGRRWNEALVKRVTGGDKITARKMRQDNEEWTPKFKLVIASNYPMQLNEVDDAIQRRILRLPIICKPDEINPNLRDELRKELPAILMRFIGGCMDWQRDGLCPPDVVKSATKDYFDDQDTFGQWLADHCNVDPLATSITATAVLYFDWCEYCEGRGIKHGARNVFRNHLLRRGFEPRNGAKARGFVGIELKERERMTL